MAKRKTIKETRDAIDKLICMTKQPGISRQQYEILNGAVVGLLWSISEGGMDGREDPLEELINRGYVITGEVN